LVNFEEMMNENVHDDEQTNLIHPK